MVTSAPTVVNGDGGSDELPRPCCGCHSMSYGRSKGWVGMWLVTSVDTDAEGSMMPAVRSVVWSGVSTSRERREEVSK